LAADERDSFISFGAEPASLSLDSTVTELRTLFIEDTTARLSAMQRVVARIRSGPPDAKALVSELCDQFHKLAGTGGMYGFPTVSTAGQIGQRQCLEVMEGKTTIGPGVLARWDEALVRMQEAIAADRKPAAGRKAASAAPRAPVTRILLCADPHVYPRDIPPGSADCSFEQVQAPEQLAAALGRDRVSAVVLVPGGAFSDTPMLLRDLRAHTATESAPLLVLLDKLSLLERIELLQLGATRILGRDTPWEVLITFATLVQPEPDASRGRIFILEHDHALALQLRDELEGRGYEASSFWHLPALLAAWQEQAADLLLVGRDATGQLSWPVLETIRKRERLRGLPVLVMIGREDETTRRLAFERGADDYLPVPYQPEELSARIDVRVELWRAARKLNLLSVRSRPSPPPVPGLPPADAPLPEPRPPRDRPPRLLLADDDPVVFRLLEPRLRAEGWQLVQATDGEQAEKVIAQGEIDLVVLDLNMPFRSGFDVLQWMTQMGLKRKTKVVVLSALNREETILRAFSLEADDFIGKPFNPEIVATRLRRLLRR
jgi:DNA-binding response OmpR family regulator